MLQRNNSRFKSIHLQKKGDQLKLFYSEPFMKRKSIIIYAFLKLEIIISNFRKWLY